MKKSLLAFPVLFVSGAACAQVALVQKMAAPVTSAAGSSTETVALPSAVVSGHLLLALVQYQVNSGGNTLTGPDASWRQMLSKTALGGGSGNYDIWCSVAASTANSFTFTQSNGGQTMSIPFLAEYSGAASSCAAAISQIAANNTPNSPASPAPALATPTLTPANVGALPLSWVGLVMGHAGNIYGVGPASGWTNVSNNNNPNGSTSDYYIMSVDQRAAAADTTTPIGDVYTASSGNPVGYYDGAVEGVLLIQPAGAAAFLGIGSSLPGGTVGTDYSQTLAVSGGAAPYTCTGTGLPPGLSFSGTVLGGTPTTAATYAPNVTCADSTTPTAISTGKTLASMTIVPEPPLAVARTSLAVRQGQYFNTGLQPSGGSGTYRCAWTGSLPPSVFQTGIYNCGLVSDSVGTVQGTYSPTYTVTDTSSPQLTLTGTFTFNVSAAAAPQPVSALSVLSTGLNGALNGFVPWPDSAWMQDISTAEVDAASDAFMNVATDGFKGFNLHPGLGTFAPGSGGGIPYTVVDSAAQNIPFVQPTIQLYGSDVTGYPLVSSQAVEDGQPACPYNAGTTSDVSDHHGIGLDRATALDFEMWRSSFCGGRWAMANGGIFDLTQFTAKPWGFTSADAAGLSIFAGLLRYDEILAGQVNHAIRFTAAHTQNNSNGGTFIAPASHAAGTNYSDANPLHFNPIEGMRLRLKAGFDISGYSATNKIILGAMKKYGMILADNGATFFFQGTRDDRWNDTDLNALKAVPSSAFDVVGMSPVYDATTAPKTSPPTITSFSASATTVAAGTPVTLSMPTVGATYAYTSCSGLVRNGASTFTPVATTTCTGYAANATPPNLGADTFFVASSPITITVQSGPPTLTLGGLGVFIQGVASTQTLVVSGGVAPYTCSASSPPSGITVSSACVVAVASTVAVGTFTVSVTATDATTPTAGTVTGNVTILVAPPLAGGVVIR